MVLGPLLLLAVSRTAAALVCYECPGRNGECDNPADPGRPVTCKSVRSLIQPSVMEELDLAWTAVQVNKKQSTIYSAMEGVFSSVSADAVNKYPEVKLAFEERKNMTFDNTTYDQLAVMTAELLEAIILAADTVPENACSFNDKTVTGKAGTFRRCLYRNSLRIADWPELQKNLLRGRDWVDGVKFTAANKHKSAILCQEDRCNDRGTRSCMECEGPNHQCMEGSAGVSMACPHTHTYCIKELSGDISNRELVARYCGTEYDKEAICNLAGDNIGIAAKGVVKCCSNDESKGGWADCNTGHRTMTPWAVLTAPLVLLLLRL